MKKITNKTFEKYSFLTSLESNEAKNAAFFIRKTPNMKADDYDSNLYIFDGKKESRVTSCSRVSRAFWLDNENIVFASSRDIKKGEAEKCKDGNSEECVAISKEENQEENNTKPNEKNGDKDAVKLFKKNVNSFCEAEFLLELEGEISNISLICENKLIYVKTCDIREDEDEFFGAQKNEKGFMRVRRIPFYSNGGDFDFHKRSNLCIYDTETNQEISIELPGYSADKYFYSKDNNKILIIASKICKTMSMYEGLFEFDLNDLSDKRAKEILSDDKFSLSYANYLNGKLIFMASELKKHGINENHKPYTLEDGQVKLLNDKDISYGNGGVQDMVLSGGKTMRRHEDYFSVLITDGVKNKIMKMDDEGNLSEIFVCDGSIEAYDFIGDKVVYIGLKEDRGQELYFNCKKITGFHDFLDEYYVAKPNIVRLKSTGFDIEGYVLLPENYGELDKVPAVLDIHGGPKTCYQETYFHEMQMLVSKGYAVFFCNPRGSNGRGGAFFDIFGLYGQVDYENIMDFTDEVLKNYSKIDSENLFVTGGSYGGYMTNHIIGMTDRFKAAVTQRCISNWTSMYGVSDIGYYFCTDQHRIELSDEEFWEKLWDVSPLKRVDKIKTPTLIIHSDKDYRCPLEQGYQFFTALMHRKVDSELLVFKDEHHGLSRVGKPNNRVERLNSISGWFEKYK